VRDENAQVPKIQSVRVNFKFSNFTSALPTLAEQYYQHQQLHKVPKFIMHQNEQCKTNTQLCICILPEVGTKGCVALFTWGL
jgi:hypothetical protein